MNLKYLLGLLVVAVFLLSRAAADEITTLDGQKYENVKDVMLKKNGLFFVSGTGSSMKGVTEPYNNLPDDIKDKYHYDPFEPGLAQARQNQLIVISTNMAFSLGTLEAARAKA